MQGERDKDDAMEEEAPHTWFNTMIGNELLMITPMKLSWQCLKHIMDERREKHMSVIQGNRPATCHHQTLHYYFEINIKDISDGNSIAIGFTTENFKTNQILGWEFNTYGYYSDGKLYHNSGKTTSSDKMEQFRRNFETKTFTKGDVVGAGINYLERNVYFVKDKEVVGSIPYNLENTLYPTIGFDGKNVIVDVNFSPKNDLDVNYDMQHSNPQPPKTWWLWHK
jgi:hypothetical protein